MNPLAFFFTMTAIGLIVPIWLGALAANGSKNDDPKTMRLPRAYLYLGAAGLPFFVFIGVMGVIQSIGDNNIPILIFCIIANMCFVMLGLILILFSVNWRFVFEDEEFVYTNIFGIKRRFKYSQITKISRYRGKNSGLLAYYVIYIGKRKIMVDYTASNFSEFERIIKRYTRKVGNRIEFIDKKTIQR